MNFEHTTNYGLRPRAHKRPLDGVPNLAYNESARPSSASSLPGNTTRIVDAWGRERWGRYDQQGRLAEVVEPNPNGDGTVADTGNLLTEYRYNTLGRLIETEQGAQTRGFKYDDLGRLTRQKLAEQTATLDDDGDFVGSGHANAAWSMAFSYDSRSNLTTQTDARGVRTNYSYTITGVGLDPLNRIQGRWYDISGPLESGVTIHAAPSVTYEYMTSGDKGRIKKIVTAGVLTEEYAYDGESRVSEYKQTVDYRTSYPMTTSYLYDTLDRVTEVHYPAQYGLTGSPRKIVANTFDSASRLTGMTYGGAVQASDLIYNAAAQTTEIKIGAAGTNQVTEQYTFDPQTGLLTNQKAMRNSSALLDLSYGYNRLGSVGTLSGKTGSLTKIIDNLNTAKNREYEFDALGRLTKAKGGATGKLWDQNYTYDRYGNRTNVTANGTAADSSPIPLDGVPNLAYDNATNRITTTGYEYDSAGNQIKAPDASGNGLLLEYDAANRVHIIKKESDSSWVQAFQYGSTNARVMDMDYGYGYLKIFASVGGTTLAEYTEFTHTVPTWAKTYTYFGDTQLATVTANGTGGEYTEFNHPDRLGTRLQTNQAGGTSYEQVTLPFGTALNAESSVTTNNKRFTSYDRSNATGMDYAVNRTYDSKQGRFTQVDPIGISAVSLSSPQTLNMYTYCGNDPINRVDPDGLFWGTLFRWLGRIFGFISRNRRAIAAIISVAMVVAPQGVRRIAGPLAGILGGNGNLGSGFAGAISVEIGLSVDRILTAMAAAVGAIANSLQSNNRKASLDLCDHWLLSYYPRVKKFFDDVWKKTQNSKTEKAPDGLEAGGIIYISSSSVSAGGLEEIGWDIYDGPVPEHGMGMGDEFDKWQIEKKRTKALSRPGDWTFLVVHSHPSGEGKPSGGGKYADYKMATNYPEAVVGMNEISVYKKGKGILCTIKR